MKKIIGIITSLILVLCLTGCGDSAKIAVDNYLAKYNALDDDVLNDMNDIVLKENLSEENKEVYIALFKKQYSNLTYKITKEQYDGDEAIVSANITVYDYYKVQKEANEYLENNPDEFNDENGNYSVDKFIAYKLEQMKNTNDKIDYTIDFYVVKTSDGWIVSSLSNSDLEKIHGIYNYE